MQKNLQQDLQQDFLEHTYLYEAVYKKDLPLVKQLLKSYNLKENIKEKLIEKSFSNSENISCLSLAATDTDHTILKELLDFYLSLDKNLNKIININILDDKLRTPLMNACLTKNYNNVLLLLQAGANINFLDKYKQNAFRIAINSNCFKVIETILDFYKNNKIVLEKILTEQIHYNGVYLPYDVRTHLTECIFDMQYNNVQKLKIIILLLEAAKSINFNETLLNTYFRDTTINTSINVLYLACQYNSLTLVNLFIEYGANVNNEVTTDNDNNITCLTYSVCRNHTKVTKSLIRANANLHINYETTLLHIAVKKHNIELLQLLLDSKKLDVNILNKENYTALHEACLQNNIESVKILLNANADININNSFNLCIIQNNIELIKLFLLHKDIIINKRDEYDRTPLMLACIHISTVEIINLFLDKGADINLLDCKKNNAYEYAKNNKNIIKSTFINVLNSYNNNKFKYTSLMEAIDDANLDKVKELLKNNADVNEVDNNNCSCIMYAIKRTKYDIFKEFLLVKNINLFLINDENETVMDIATKPIYNQNYSSLLLQRITFDGRYERDLLRLNLLEKYVTQDVVRNIVKYYLIDKNLKYT
jgi:ankyrin repeat protein